MEGLEGLPAWVQVLACGVVFVFTAVTAVFGYVNKKVAGRVDESREGVVVSATIADGRAVRDLTIAVGKMTDVARNLQDTLRNTQDGERRLVDAIDDLKNTNRDLIEVIERKASGAAV